MLSYNELKKLVCAYDLQVEDFTNNGHKHKYIQDVYTLTNFIKLFNNSCYYLIKSNHLNTLKNKSIDINKESVNYASKEFCEKILKQWTVDSNVLKILSPGECPDINENSLRFIYSLPSNCDIHIFDLLNDNIKVSATRKVENFQIDSSTLSKKLNERSVNILDMQAYAKPNGYDMVFVDYYQFELY